MRLLSTFASKVEIEETRSSLLWASEFNWGYVVMNVLAATLATYGLFANNASVVIGAMIIAMLLGPISSLALGIIESNFKLIVKSLLTLAGGVLIVCITAAFWSWVNIRLPVTDEIMARTSPNFIDLMVGLVGGMAGAYSLVYKKLAVAFVGVAIATALVPPLCSACILLVKGDYMLAKGAFLLTFTNIVGIQFGYSTVLWLKGLSQKTLSFDKSIWYFIRKNAIGLCVLAGLGIMLTYNLSFVVQKQKFENNTRDFLAEQMDGIPGSYVSKVWYQSENGKMVVRAIVSGLNAPDKIQVAAMESKIPSNYLNIPNELRVRFIKTEIISRDGNILKE